MIDFYKKHVLQWRRYQQARVILMFYARDMKE